MTANTLAVAATAGMSPAELDEWLGANATAIVAMAREAEEELDDAKEGRKPRRIEGDPELVEWLGANAPTIIQSLNEAQRQIDASKVFTGTVVRVTKEKKSTRGSVILFTDTDRVYEGLPEGHERVRTERTDNPAGLGMARKVLGLRGHRVLVWVELESFNKGNGTMRVLRHIKDLGVDPNYQ